MYLHICPRTNQSIQKYTGLKYTIKEWIFDVSAYRNDNESR